ncbi:glycosyltransferase family 4 protein [Thalassococcus lentus]|uniref:Glycosyltransferase family 4 protein n=1 Tax=Thalassococcus lentus TaxID=1210524 RepID=A0ABT4XMS3_9RHOB|nr:glycosyltransferase family 4 protein [Thalassococcus lentus]MDA7423246.1 glycosyltransferase family 4 protein [Thalassococcus lentus]
MKTDNRLNIAYLCDHSPLDRNLYSGGNARIYDALRAHAGEVTILSQSWHMAEPIRRLIQSAPESFNLRARWRAHLLLAPLIARGVRSELSKGKYDVLFGAYSFQSMHKVAAPYPLVRAYTSDATQTIYRLSEVGQQFDRKFTGGGILDRWVERQEKTVFGNMDVLLWPSQWLLQEAQQRYGLDAGHCHLLPWGANIGDVPPPGARQIDQSGPVQLLLIGRDWFAKGGPIAFDTMQALRANGIDARLTVVGCTPPDFHCNEWVTVHPQLNKAIPEQAETFDACLSRAHFLVQPSFESYGFAFCEASAFALPSLCFRVGGVPVRDGVNGYALPVGSTAEEFANRVSTLIRDPNAYAALSASSRAEYEQTLNWDAWGKAAAEVLSDAVSRQKSALK